MSTNYNIPETIVIDCNKSKIKNIFYGIHENPIKWPQMNPIKNPAGYLNITKELYFHVKDNKLNISGGYLADHERSKLIYEAYKVMHNYKGAGYNSICELIPNYPKRAQLYKEILIEFEDGTVCKYSKWKTIKIINWKM